jgi:hypothetical protein
MVAYIDEHVDRYGVEPICAERGGAARAALSVRGAAAEPAGAGFCPDACRVVAARGDAAFAVAGVQGGPPGRLGSVFCDQYRRWLKTQEPVLCQHHAPGDKLFVDYAGQTVPITDRHTGEFRPAQIFIGVLGCSNYTFAEATFSQQLPGPAQATRRIFAALSRSKVA